MIHHYLLLIVIALAPNNHASEYSGQLLTERIGIYSSFEKCHLVGMKTKNELESDFPVHADEMRSGINNATWFGQLIVGFSCIEEDK